MYRYVSIILPYLLLPYSILPYYHITILSYLLLPYYHTSYYHIDTSTTSQSINPESEMRVGDGVGMKIKPFQQLNFLVRFL